MLVSRHTWLIGRTSCYSFVMHVLCLERSARVGSSPVLRKSTKNPANEQFLFHGTNRSCRLGEAPNNVRLCRMPKCHLCSVIYDSFDISKCGRYPVMQRDRIHVHYCGIQERSTNSVGSVTESTRHHVLQVSKTALLQRSILDALW